MSEENKSPKKSDEEFDEQTLFNEVDEKTLGGREFDGVILKESPDSDASDVVASVPNAYAENRDQEDDEIDGDAATTELEVENTPIVTTNDDSTPVSVRQNSTDSNDDSSDGADRHIDGSAIQEDSLGEPLGKGEGNEDNPEVNQVEQSDTSLDSSTSDATPAFRSEAQLEGLAGGVGSELSEGEESHEQVGVGGTESTASSLPDDGDVVEGEEVSGESALDEEGISDSDVDEVVSDTEDDDGDESIDPADEDTNDDSTAPVADGTDDSVDDSTAPV
ncbi:MAG: hypothetical protein OCC49_18380, partial [Fibrobacterales bacterium]